MERKPRNLFARLATAAAFAMPGLSTVQMPKPHVRSRAKKARYTKPRKQRTTGSARQFLRYQLRLARAYKPGTIGISAVSAEIKKEYGAILSRQARRYAAQRTGKAFVAFTAGR